MKPYPSIEQFKNVIKSVRLSHDYKGKDENNKPVYQHTEPYPILTFIGTVKIHGTNAGIVKYSDGRVEFQSRSRVLSLEDDNSGFMNEMVQKDLNFLFNGFEFNDHVAIYGEWCGGNIQKGVAINGLPKMFVIFGIKVDGEWINLPFQLHDNNNGIYNILQFPTYRVNIDFSNPELSQNKIIDMTVSVEDCCPVGEHFGINGVGEGIVFTYIKDQNLKFKSKGEKHSVTKIKKLNPVDTESINSINEFVEYVVTENRLEQGLSILKENNIEIDSKSTGQFLSWVVKDVLKEEGDTIEKNKLDESKVKSSISNKARTWFFNNI
jgi:hypothetical protein